MKTGEGIGLHSKLVVILYPMSIMMMWIIMLFRLTHPFLYLQAMNLNSYVESSSISAN